MDDTAIRNLTSSTERISADLDRRPDSWREHLQAVRDITESLEILDTSPFPARLSWQIPLIATLQRVAFADADNGAIQDIADWCLRQALTLLHIHADNIEILALIGRNWLLRAQKSLANISRTEHASSSSSGGSFSTGIYKPSARAFAEAEQRLHAADYVEARGILIPATDYLKRAVDTARTQGTLDGILVSTAAEACMSLGNVTSSRINDQYYSQAIAYLQEAADMQDYALPAHLESYLEEFGSLYSSV